MAELHERIIQASIPVPEAGCWIWERCLTDGGYGQLKINGRDERAHRASWLAFKGEIPPGLYVCHRCDTPSCVNPEHLFLGTPLENMQDRDRKGRNKQCKGEKHGLSKLKAGDVADIRRRHNGGEMQKDLAAEYSISRTQLHRIVMNKRWALEV